MSDIQKKFEALKGATRRLRNSTANERAEKLKTLWATLVEHKEELFAASAKERRTSDVDVAAELVMIKGELDHAVKNLPKWVKPQKVKGSMSTMGKKCEIRYQSKGVVLNMGAYNAPTAEAIVPMVAAISAGNAFVLKPSEHAPYSAEVLEKIIHKAFPSDEAIVVQGGVDVAQALLALPFDHIYYTGGHTVGKIVMKAAADNFATVTLEMGGKSPVIVDETANLDNAATKIIWGRNMNAGQVCIGPEYVMVHESQYENLLKLLPEKVEALYNSEKTGLENSNYLPRIINARHHQRISGLISDAVEKGARVVCGGDTNEDDLFIAPTVLTDVSEDMKIMQEEVFGPVLCVLPYKNREEVLDLIDKRPNPLALYVYSTNNESIEYFLTNTSSGSAVVNNNCVQAGTNPNLPFGGTGSSGMGRSGGFVGFKEMSNARSIIHQPLDRLRDLLIMLPPYSDRYKSLIMKGTE